MKTLPAARPSPLAGRWYPDDPLALAESVDGYLQAARLPELRGAVVGVMAPHAGHLYSGPVAGYAFRALQGLAPELVAVVSPMHHPYPYPLLTSLHRAYWTPLGEIEVDQTAVAALDEALHARLDYGLTPVAQDPEHSLEIELPFLQRALGGPFRLLPVMVRDQTAQTTHALGVALAEVLRQRDALLVASTDLSHFYNQATAERLDGELLRRVAAFDPLAILRAEDEGVGFACGKAALAAVMWAAQELGARRAVVLRHATSGDVTGDRREVVGYGAAVLLKDV
jgi:MEMO1 family protein